MNRLTFRQLASVIAVPALLIGSLSACSQDSAPDEPTASTSVGAAGTLRTSGLSIEQQLNQLEIITGSDQDYIIEVAYQPATPDDQQFLEENHDDSAFAQRFADEYGTPPEGWEIGKVSDKQIGDDTVYVIHFHRSNA